MSQDLETRSRALFEESIENLDMRVRSRLAQARHAALASAAARRRPWVLALGRWTPAVGATAVLMLGAVLWFAVPIMHRGMPAADGAPNLDDLEIVAASDEASGDPLEMLQDDIEFYDWANRAGISESAAQG